MRPNTSNKKTRNEGIVQSIHAKKIRKDITQSIHTTKTEMALKKYYKTITQTIFRAKF